MSVTPTSIVNQAIQIIGDDQPPVTGVYPTFDNSPAGNAASILYGPVVATVARQFGWDFSRNVGALSTSGNTPPPEWSYEYIYPVTAIEIRQLQPPTVTNAFDPQPQVWSVGNAAVSGIPTKVIWSNLASAVCVYTNNPPPSVWDPLFQETVVRLLASEMAQAVAGKPDVSKDLLEQASGFANVGMSRPD